jgi:hypothetical protein
VLNKIPYYADTFELCKPSDKGTKCINKNCQNHTNEGTFKGDLCYPCYEYLLNGEYNKLSKVIPRLIGAYSSGYHLVTDGTAAGTKVTLNGMEVTNLVEVDFSISFDSTGVLKLTVK